MKPIEQAFKAAKAAACLANEWRDTIYYIGLGIESLHLALQQDSFKKAALHLCALPILGTAMREQIRSQAWYLSADLKKSFPLRLVGVHYNKPVDAKKNSYAAMTACMSSMVLFSPLPIIWGSPDWKTTTLPLMATLAMLLGYKLFYGDLKQIPDQYFNRETGMWNWPQRRGGNGGGPTQTQKLMDGFKDIGRSLGRGLAPRPSYAPATIRYAANLNA